MRRALLLALLPITGLLVECSEAGPSTPAPDLIIESVSHSPATPQADDPILVTAVVKNNSTVDAGASEIGFLVGVRPVPTVSVTPLAGGATASLSFRVGARPERVYRDTAVADFGGAVSESDETNNTSTSGRYAVGLVGLGTATIDGILSPGEWDAAGQMSFLVNTPEGGTTPATLFVMNDQTNLYLAVRFARSALDAGNSLSFEFDGNSDNIRDDGDDEIGFSAGIGFKDLFDTTAPPCASGGLCSFLDTDYGGSNDGAAALANDGTFTVYELYHPLSSGDVHDFSRSVGQTLGLSLSLRILTAGASCPTGCADTTFPMSGFLQITASPPVP